MGSALSIIAIEIPASGWSNGTITLQSAFGVAGTHGGPDQTPDASIVDWGDVYDDSDAPIAIVANDGANIKRLHPTNLVLAGNFFRLVSSEAQTATLKIYYRSVFG
jgi:hypothetical protein